MYRDLIAPRRPAPTSRHSACAAVFALTLLAGTAFSVRASTNPFTDLNGPWRGPAQVSLTNGKSERMACRAYYRQTDSGSKLGLAILCASQTGFKIELRSSLEYRGGVVSGQWEERTFNAAGQLNGSATSTRILVDISGGVSGTMSVALNNGGHSVLIATQGTGFSAVSINLSPG